MLVPGSDNDSRDVESLRLDADGRRRTGMQWNGSFSLRSLLVDSFPVRRDTSRRVTDR